ncbi:hypothetical protein I5Q34_13085 [Streptomyces sp. AV19]|uniref:hypothetical protein n=1 Tax=Streptomyces sp. AV19 TaxID=2793068 RepID=UPI0018FEE355|nr:hypothetical protein [Streptomyces sp. AV19]MBH1935197.1 hypothetical protein [Streptomyces sp. AV19]MDG4532026.1 hypothetical protein [Streptomyces sp. AV19]
MPSFYEELLSTDFGALDTLAAKWGDTHSKINGLAKRVGDEVLRPLKDKGYWEGAAAPYAWAQIDDIQRQVGAAAKVADAVRKVIQDGAGELKAAQRDLKDAVTRATAKGLHVGRDGAVSRSVVNGVCSADAPDDASAQKDMDAAQDEIIEICRRGHLADENLSITLMQDIGVDQWFNSKPQLTDINHTSSIGTDQYNALSLAMRGKDPHPARKDTDPYDLGMDWATGTGPGHQDFTNGDRFTELIRRSESMDDIRKQTLKQWRETGEGEGKANYSISKDGKIGALKKLFGEDLPAIVTGDDDGLGQAFLGSYSVHYEIKGQDPDGSVIVNYRLENTTSVESAIHYMGYYDWQRYLNPPAGPGRGVSQTVTWTERLPAHGH